MEYEIFMIAAPISLGIVIFVTASVRRFLKEILARVLIMYLVSTAGLLILNVAELLHPTPEGTFFLAKLQYLFYCAIPFCWISFTTIYADLEEKIINRRTAVHLVIPVVFNIIVHTNGLHHLYWEELFFPRIAGYTIMRSIHGPLFWIFGVYLYATLIYGSILITRKTLLNHSLYASQRNHLILGAITPLLLNLLFVSQIFPFMQKDFTPVGFAAAGSFFYFGIYWKRFLQIVPIARNIIVEEMNTPVLVMDKQQNLIDYNTASRKMFNLSEDSLGKNILLQPSIGTFISREKVAHILEVAGSFSCCHDGRNYEVHHNPLYQNKSYFVGHLVMIMDVTQYIQILGEKTKLIEQLEETNLVLKNTQNQLIQNEKLASIGQLAAGVAHEINNPTGFVLRNLGVLQEYVDVFKALFDLYEKLLDKRKVVSSNREEIEADIRKLKETEDLDYILRDIGPLLQESTYGAKRIRDIVQSLRDFSRTDQAGADYSNLNECIEQAIRISWNQLKYKCTVEKNLSAAPVMFFNKNKIEQVLVNILLNAADSIEGHGKIHITTAIEGQEVKVIVSDNGQGIQPEHIRRIFDPFFTTKEIGKGTGLGMYISHQIIKDHGGRIEVESRIDHGTRITIVLPIQGQLQHAKKIN